MTRISNRPIPDGHPFKGGCVIFGITRPGGPRRPSTPSADPIPSTCLPPFEVEAHRVMEESLHRLYEQHTGQPWREPSQSSESDTPENPGDPSPGTSMDKE